MYFFIRATVWAAVLSAAPIAYCQQGTIAGTLLDTTGSSIAQAQVKLALDGRAADQVTRSDENGTFSFSNVTPGPYHLSFAAKGFALKTVDGEIHPGETLDLVPTTLAVEKLTTEVNVTQSQTEIAEAQIKREEKQRLIGIVPNYFVTYDPHPAPLNTRQKAQLTWKLFLDPYVFLTNGLGAVVDQARNTNPGFGQGAQGYAKRYGASYADFATSVGISRFVLPVFFKQDSRYFYKGTGTKASRFSYAIRRAVICQGDNKQAQLCYSSIIGDFAPGFITNYYYPSADRNSNAVLVQNGAIALGARAGANLFQEFIARKLTPKKRLRP